MKQYSNPPRDKWSRLLLRPSQINGKPVQRTVDEVFNAVQNKGDSALIEFTKRFDGVGLESVELPDDDLRLLAKKANKEDRLAIDQAYRNIKKFHLQQRMKKEVIETMPGVECWREARPIERVGLYVPGGSAPLVSTLLMLGVPAQLAGCREVYVATPPNKDGLVDAAICYAAQKVGATKLFRVGGAQAIAAFCMGTETIAKVDKIFGPGNQFVTCAKEMAGKYGVAIDMPAGPSEVLVMADDSANVEYVAADLLSQAEHGPDSQVMLVTTSERVQREVMKEIKVQLAELPRKDIAREALENSCSLLFASLEEAIDFTNKYGSEHVIISCQDPDNVAKRIISAGSVFLGNYSPESAGDYASGTNHTLPTAGWARSASGVSLDSFVKKITFQRLSKKGLERLAPTITRLAQIEGLDAHAQAVTRRLA